MITTVLLLYYHVCRSTINAHAGCRVLSTDTGVHDTIVQCRTV